MIKIGITGPESTGKTTLSLQLSSHYQIDVIAEYAREYLSIVNGFYTKTDLDKIALRQYEYMTEQVDQNLLICDTEMLVMKVWSEFKYGNCSPLVKSLWEMQKIDLYLLCAPDIPFEEDPLRENPEQREQLFEIYKAELEKANCKFVIISGHDNQRFKKSVTAIDNLLQ